MDDINIKNEHLKEHLMNLCVDKKTIDRIVVQIKTLPAGKVINFTAGKIYLTKRSARFIKN